MFVGFACMLVREAVIPADAPRLPEGTEPLKQALRDIIENQNETALSYSSGAARYFQDGAEWHTDGATVADVNEAAVNVVYGIYNDGEHADHDSGSTVFALQHEPGKIFSARVLYKRKKVQSVNEDKRRRIDGIGSKDLEENEVGEGRGALLSDPGVPALPFELPAQ